MADDTMLSERARQRMAALLPDLVAAVRARRRRRHVRRAATLLLLAGGLAAWWASPGVPQPAAARGPEIVAAPPGSASASPSSSESLSAAALAIVATDPAILARCSVATVERAEWYVDDDSLQALLRAEARDPGLVRIGDRVLVNETAIDPWPQVQ